jgi:outer membrane murein-binding lipoprotein Lpp
MKSLLARFPFLGPQIPRRRAILCAALALATTLVSGGCKTQEQADVNQLKANLADMQKRMAALEKVVEPRERQVAYRERFDHRNDLDRRKYSEQELSEAENLYQAAEREWGSPKCLEGLRQMLEKYPNVNRSGCALLDIAINTPGPESEQALKQCIRKYDDCYYGDGVRIGAFARFCLAQYYAKSGEKEKAEALYQEIKDNYADAIDHQGQLLVSRAQRHPGGN